MTPHGFLALSAAALAFALASVPAHACRGARCADAKSVVVEQSFRQVIVGPPVMVVDPERVMVSPERVDELITTPETVAVYDEIDMQPAGYRWEERNCPPGLRRCKIFEPAETKYVERDVVVRPGRRVSVVTPPEYAWRRRVVAVRPGYVIDQRTSVRGGKGERPLRARDLIPPGGWIGW